MQTNVVTANQVGERVPLVARFATIQYVLDDALSETNRMKMTIMPGDKTHPRTFSATTKSGQDNDSDDQGAD